MTTTSLSLTTVTCNEFSESNEKYSLYVKKINLCLRTKTRANALCYVVSTIYKPVRDL